MRRHLSTLLTKLVDAVSWRTGLAAVRARLPAGTGDGEVTIDVPGYRQVNSYACGAIAGLMVLRTFKPDASVRAFIARVAPDPEDGTPATRITRALEHHGIAVRRRYDLDFDKIARAIDAGHPIITLRNTSDPDSSHWIVVYGVARRPRRLFVGGNGLLSNPPIPWGTFRRQWSQQGYGLVCAPRRRR
jgi:hypothetical protein